MSQAYAHAGGMALGHAAGSLRLPRRDESIGCSKCKHMVNTHNTELVHCNLNVTNVLHMIYGGGVLMCGP